MLPCIEREHVTKIKEFQELVLSERSGRVRLHYFEEVDTASLWQQLRNLRNADLSKSNITFPDDVRLLYKAWLDIDQESHVFDMKAANTTGVAQASSSQI